MPHLTRRNLLVLGGAGAAGLAVAGCAEEDDPREEGRDDDLLQSAADAEALLRSAYDSVRGDGDEAEVGRQFADASATRVTELERLGSGPAQAGASGDDPTEAQGAAIAAYRECVRFGSTTEVRAAAIQFLTQVSAEQATLRGLDGTDQSPTPFVSGQEEEPYVASQDDDDEGTTSTSTTTTSSSTTTTEEGE